MGIVVMRIKAVLSIMIQTRRSLRSRKCKYDFSCFHYFFGLGTRQPLESGSLLYESAKILSRMNGIGWRFSGSHHQGYMNVSEPPSLSVYFETRSGHAEIFNHEKPIRRGVMRVCIIVARRILWTILAVHSSI